MNQFKAYERVPDKVFHNWLIKKKNYENCTDIIPDSLMLDALNRYQSLKIEGEWKITSPKDKRIMALTTQIQQIHQLLQGTTHETQVKFK